MTRAGCACATTDGQESPHTQSQMALGIHLHDRSCGSLGTHLKDNLITQLFSSHSFRIFMQSLHENHNETVDSKKKEERKNKNRNEKAISNDLVQVDSIGRRTVKDVVPGNVRSFIIPGVHYGKEQTDAGTCNRLLSYKLGKE